MPPLARRASDVPMRRRSTADAGQMEAAERAVLTELNACRRNPAGYAAKVEDERKCIQGLVLHRPGLPHPVQLQEGEVPYREVIAELSATRPLPELERAPRGLVRAAREHAADLGSSGGTGHHGSDGSRPADRMSRHGSWEGVCLENLFFGEGSATRIVVALLADDGVPGRGHRRNILHPDIRACGVAFAPHARYGRVCVQTFAAGYTDGPGGSAGTAGRDVVTVPSTDPDDRAEVAVRRRRVLQLLDASRLSEQSMLDLTHDHPGLVPWLDEGRRADEAQTAAKLEALQKARDLGALSAEQFEQAAGRLLPRTPAPETVERYALLAQAFSAGALSESEYREAVARVHTGTPFQEGSGCEMRRTDKASWAPGVVQRMTADSGRLQIFAAEEGLQAGTAQQWPQLRPRDASTKLAALEAELAAARAERDAAQRDVAQLLAAGPALGDPQLLCAPAPPPQGSRYELYGFAFEVTAAKPIALGAVLFFTRAAQPARVSVYVAEGGLDAARRRSGTGGPPPWRRASAPRLLSGDEPHDEPLRVELLQGVRVMPAKRVGVMVHSADDRRAVQYERQQTDPVAGDEVLSILRGDGVQQDMSIGCAPKQFAGFALVGAVEYMSLGVHGAAGADALAAPDSATSLPTEPAVGSPVEGGDEL
eukprot:TRINITY_DN19523_c0_g2_i1.p1 TRINITY_DN19523_c0_g2~~TRINITY_DN19523_c0_g2_i1.p1  ORF type:complete len:679 (+),score=258.81 TRINITY_DN19523_c0_g2_i1:80-2038(+)